MIRLVEIDNLDRGARHQPSPPGIISAKRPEFVRRQVTPALHKQHGPLELLETISHLLNESRGIWNCSLSKCAPQVVRQ